LQNIVKQDNTFVVAMASRIVPQKGIIEFLKIAQKTIEQSENIEFWLAGSNVAKYKSYFQNVMSIISNNAERIKYVGELSSCKHFFEMSNLVVSTSLVFESFGLTLIEAMSLGKAVIAPPYGGSTEIILNNKTGLLIDPNNILDFSNAIIKLSQNQKLANAFGQAGYLRYQNVFSQTNFLESFSSQYINVSKKQICK
jgi:glycosyltransferase involved in cell wall biosynthesis